MGGRWISGVVALAGVTGGCDRVFGLDRGIDAPPGPGEAAIDAPPPEVCTYANQSKVQFDSAAVVPLHDFAADGTIATVSGFITNAMGTQSRTGAVLDASGTWRFDQSRDGGLGGYLGVRPVIGDPTRAYGLAIVTTTNYVFELGLQGTTWTEGSKHPLLQNERVGNVRALAGTKVFVTTQHPVQGDPDTFLKLRVADGTAWDEQDRMAAINTAQIPDLGVLTRDGLTLIYSARPRGTLDFDLFISRRTDLEASFPVGEPITALNTTTSDEVEPWIEDSCGVLYFRRGPTYFSGIAQVSEIWRATP